MGIDVPTRRRAPAALDDAPWTEHTWRGQKLYKCRLCPHVQSFDVGKIYEHAQRFHPTEKKE
jgi:hypothetical protein